MYGSCTHYVLRAETTFDIFSVQIFYQSVKVMHYSIVKTFVLICENHVIGFTVLSFLSLVDEGDVVSC